MSRSSAAAAHAGHPGHPGHTTLPNLSSNLRMGTPNANPQHLPQQSPVHHPQPQVQVPAQGHPHAHSNPHAHSHSHPRSHSHSHQHSQAQGRHNGVSVIMDSRRGQSQQYQQSRQAESMDSSDSEQSDAGHREARGGSRGDASGDGDYTSSPGENTPSRRAGAQGPPDDGGGGSRRGTDGTSAANPVLIGDEMVSGGGGGDAGGNGTSRKHGKRLTTKEEVSLFDICNHRAEEFGQRSNLCNWWRTVTSEFTREHGHPYSWHSVRRKVELVTKQRMKFLDDQREKGGTEADDMSNPRWRAAVDAWIPTWRRWEEAEAQRIEKRDSRRPRKRKTRSWEPAGAWEMPNSSEGAWRPVSSPAVENNRAFGQNQSPFLPPSSTQAQVRLPPGFDNMFNSASSPTTPGAGGAQTAAMPSAPENASHPNQKMMSAMLETLGKLNKHLDTVNPDQQNGSPVASALAGSHQRDRNSRQVSSQQDDDGGDVNPSPTSAAAIDKLKEELRQELRQEIRNELEKDRAVLEDRLDSVQRTQDMILEMLRQEPA